MKKILVAVASLAIALAANFGIASAHPFRDPTPSSEPAPRVDKTTTTASPANAVEADETEADEAEADEVDEDMDEDEEVDEDKDEDEADEDEADDDDAASVTTTTRTAPVMTTGRGDRHHKVDRNRSGHDGHGDDD